MAVSMRTRWMLQMLVSLAVAWSICRCFTVNASACPARFDCIPLPDCQERHSTIGHPHQHIHSNIIFECRGMLLEVAGVCCPPVARPSKMGLLPTEECGVDWADRVLGGKVARLRQFPWMALLGYTKRNSNEKEFKCGGTLINKRYILTAAHCLTDDGSVPDFVRLGEHTLNLTRDCTCGGYFVTTECTEDQLDCSPDVLDIRVEDAVKHERYSNNNQTLKNDIALLRLDRDVDFTEFVMPICLPFDVDITGEEEANYTVAGWGRTSNRNAAGSNMLQFVFLRSTPLADCNPQHNGKLDKGHLCAGNGGMDACKGDSGGPMSNYYSVPKNTSARVFQIGIVSYSKELRCGAEKSPTIFTRVNTYLDWILDNIHE